VPHFVSFAASIAELAHAKEIAYSITQPITHPAYLMLWELKPLLFGIYAHETLVRKSWKFQQMLSSPSDSADKNILTMKGGTNSRGRVHWILIDLDTRSAAVINSRVSVEFLDGYTHTQSCRGSAVSSGTLRSSLDQSAVRSFTLYYTLQQYIVSTHKYKQLTIIIITIRTYSRDGINMFTVNTPRSLQKLFLVLSRTEIIGMKQKLYHSSRLCSCRCTNTSVICYTSTDTISVS